jgi:hypothetical protein
VRRFDVEVMSAAYLSAMRHAGRATAYITGLLL